MSSMDYNKILVETLQCNNLGLSIGRRDRGN